MNLNEKYTKIIDCSYRPSFGREIDHHEFHVCVYNNNSVEIYGIFDEEKFDGCIITISKEEKNKLIEKINENKYWLIPNHISSKGDDGDYNEIIFFKENGEIMQICGGYMPNNESFENIYEACMDVIKDISEGAHEIIRKKILNSYYKK